MNAYYHEFSIGFNLWMVFLLVAILLMAVLGTRQYARVRGQIVKKFDSGLLVRVSAVMAVVLGFMITAESSSGIIQFMDNHIDAATDASWSLISLPFVVLSAALVIGIILYFVGYVAGLAKAGLLFTELEYLGKEYSARQVRKRQQTFERANRNQYHSNRNRARRS